MPFLLFKFMDVFFVWILLNPLTVLHYPMDAGTWFRNRSYFEKSALVIIVNRLVDDVSSTNELWSTDQMEEINEVIRLACIHLYPGLTTHAPKVQQPSNMNKMHLLG